MSQSLSPPLFQPVSQSLNVFHQPKPFYMIFSLEFWERFGFYGVQAILAVYFVRQLGYSEAKADIVFASFAALVYALVALGGKIGDSFLGTKRTMALGGITLALGYFLLGLSSELHVLFFIGLGAIAIGNGLFKANPSSLLSRCYEEGDPRLDGAFIMYYMAINIGAMISMLLVPYLAVKYNWTVGFYICAFGLVLCLFTYALMRGSVKNIGSVPDMKPLSLNKLSIAISGVIIGTLICAWLMLHVTVAHIIMYVIGVIVLFFYILETFRLKGKERLKMIASLILIFEAFLFFILYSQMPTSLNFFAIHNVQHNLLGIKIAPESFQSLDPIWIVIFSPMLATIFNVLGSKKRDFAMPMKFAIGMVLCACAFLVLPLGIKTANAQGIISSNWMIICYAFQAAGELLISGLGVSMVSQLVPPQLRGFIMGAWFLSTSFASIVAGYVASFTAAPARSGSVNPINTLPVYSHVFMEIGTCAAVIALIMLISAPLLKRLMCD